MAEAANVQLGRLSLEVGLVNGSGVVDVLNPTEGWNLPDEVVAKLGAFVTKTVTLEPRRGNPEPVHARWGANGSVVNSVGLANPGVERAAELWRTLPLRLGIPIIGSIEGVPEHVAELVALLAASTPVAAFELNLSCPNVSGGLVAADAVATGRAVAAARAATDLPLIAKLTPACGAIGDVARAAEAAGADAICCTNTMPVLAGSAAGALLGSGLRAGLSGPDLHPIALRCVADVAEAVALPVIGLGGVDSLEAARRMWAAGAAVIGVGTAAWLDPHLVGRLRDVIGAHSPLGLD